MSELSPWLIMLAAIVSGNMVLNNFLGLCPFVACSSRLRTAFWLGAAVALVMTCTVAINWAIYHLVLAPLKMDQLWLVTFIAVIAAFVQLAEILIERFSRRLYQTLGVFLPLITVNCAILGAALMAISRQYGFWQSMGFAFGSGVGWLVVIVLMAALRHRMEYGDLPAAFRGTAAALATAGMMALAFSAFSGMLALR